MLSEDKIQDLRRYTPLDVTGKSLDGHYYSAFIRSYDNVLVYDINNFFSTDNILQDQQNVEKYCNELLFYLNEINPEYIISSIHVFEMSTDILLFELISRIIETYKKISSLKNFIILVNYNIHKYDEKSEYISKIQNLPNVYQTPFFLHLVWCWYETIGVHSRWKHTNNKFLFLTGKLDRPYRLPALHEFLKSPIQKRLRYSCQTSVNDEEVFDRIAEVMTFILAKKWTREETKNYINNHKSSLDGVLGDTKKWLGVYNIPEEFYHDILIEIISETDHCRPIHITEKSFRPIVLGYPFIHIQGSHGNMLNQYGFRTFHEFLDMLPIHNLNFLDNIHNTIKNVMQLTRTIQNTETRYKIDQIINYNQRHAKKLHKDTVSTIEKHIPNFSKWKNEYFLVGNKSIYPKELYQNYPSMAKLTHFI